jgi:hypothetical protein
MDLDKEECILEEERIPVPPDAAYNSRDEAYSALKEHSIQFSYRFHITKYYLAGRINQTRIYYSYNKSK